MQRSDLFLVLATTVSLATSACGGAQTEAGTTTTTTTTTSSSSRRREVLRVRLHGDIRAACPGVSVPTFDFDSSDVDPAHRDALRPLADCMNLPGVRTRRFALIGHTDPVGTADYNATLGMERATSIKEVLVSMGVAAARIDASTRGEVAAAGSTPDEWPSARRVEIEFVAASP